MADGPQDLDRPAGAELASPAWDLAWRRGVLPDGPVELWVAVFDAGGELMGAAPTPAHTSPWAWRAGRLCVGYAVTVPVTRAGRYAAGLVCAVNPAARAWAPVFAVDLGPPQLVRPGNTIMVTDALIRIDTIAATPGIQPLATG